MEYLSLFVEAANSILKWPLIIGLLGAGVYLTVRLGFIQFRRLAHGFAVTTGKYDDPDEPGDVSHFQALTTALSATVGVGNIAGVAMAIHIGGPGALFWMWVTAFLGMATKYSEVTLAQRYRDVSTDHDPSRWEGSVSGGPMYYIERGVKEVYGWNWKPVAVFFAFALMLTSFMTGNAVQANTISVQVLDTFGIDQWITGLITASIVFVVIVGGIRRIGRFTSIVAPVMAAIYVLGALTIIALNIDAIPGAFGTIITEAFRPTAGVAGTGIGVFLATLTYGVQRGLFSNEAGQGSAPIAHSAAKTDEPVSEGVVALLEPFIDTLIICTMTGLVIVSTGVFADTTETAIAFEDSNVSFVVATDNGGYASAGPGALEPIPYLEGAPRAVDGPQVGYIDLGVEELFVDEQQQQPFSGTVYPERGLAVAEDGTEYAVLYGDAYRNSAPLTSLAFERGLDPVGLGGAGRTIVLLSVILFAISTSISWSYYGDRCANYLFGPKAILPFKVVFVAMHFIGATLAVTTIWDLGDVALSLVTLPNVITLVVLSGVLVKLTDSYFEREPWHDNEEVHKRVVAEKKARREEERRQKGK